MLARIGSGADSDGSKIDAKTSRQRLYGKSVREDRRDENYTVCRIIRGPPCDIPKRLLIFDSLQKIVDPNNFSSEGRTKDIHEDRGTFMYSWGAGFHGQLGRKATRGQKAKSSTLPKMIELFEPIRQIACGGMHSAALSDSGKLYTWGDGRMGQLGNLKEGHSSRFFPRVVDSLVGRESIKHVACGTNHTVCITSRGELYSWGSGRYGQTGHGDRAQIRFPRKVELDADHAVIFSRVACGDRHTAALSKSGFVWTFGSGEHGQLGHGDTNDVFRPRAIESFKCIRISVVECGAVYTAALSNEGALMIWGFAENLHGRGNDNFQYSPRRINSKDRFIQLACGHDHIIVLNDKGDVYTRGSGGYSQIGNGDSSDSPGLKLVLQDKNVMQVSAGRYHSAALNRYGVLYTWGCTEMGQLGHHRDGDVRFPTIVETLLGNVVGQVVCGDNHTIALTSVPYSKISDDMLDWYNRELLELQHKRELVRKSHRGLSRSDRIAVREYRMLIDRQFIDFSKHLPSVRAIKRRQTKYLDESRDSQREGDEEADLQTDKEALPADSAIDVNSVDRVGSLLGEGELEQENLQDVQPTAESSLLKRTQSRSKTAARRSFILPDFEDLQQGSSKVPQPPPRESQSARLSRPEKKGGTATGSRTQRARLKFQKGKKKIRKAAADRDDTGDQSGDSDQSDGVEAEYMERHESGENAKEQRLVVWNGDSVTIAGSSARFAFHKESAVPLQLMSISFQMAGVGVREAEKEYQRVYEYVFTLKKRYDVASYDANQAQLKLRHLKSHLRLLRSINESCKQVDQTALKTSRSLSMQLDTVTLKTNETEENRRVYELSVGHLKEQKIEIMRRLENLRQVQTQNNICYRKMKTMLRSASAEQRQAENDTREFNREMRGFYKFLSSQMRALASVCSTMFKESSFREQEHKVKTARILRREEARLIQLRQVNITKLQSRAEIRHILGDCTTELQKRQHQHHILCEAAGLSDPEEIIAKYFLRHDIHAELVEEAAAVKQKNERLRELRESLQQQLYDMMENRVHHKWRDVDEMQERHRVASSLEKSRRSEFERLRLSIAFYETSVRSLLGRIREAEGEEPFAPGTGIPGEVANKNATSVVFTEFERAVVNLTQKAPVEKME